MDIIQGYIAQEAFVRSSSQIVLPRNRYNLLQSLFDLLKLGMKISGTAFFECQFELNRCVRCGNIAARNRLEYRLPGIRTEPRYRNVSIVEIEEGCRERLKICRGLVRQIYYLYQLSDSRK